MAEPLDEALRQYILGKRDSDDEPVKEAPERGTLTTNEEPHCIVISSEVDGPKAFARLYGLHLRVDLGPGKENFELFGVICEIDGSGMRETSSNELAAALHEVAAIPSPTPWKKLKRTEEPPML